MEKYDSSRSSFYMIIDVFGPKPYQRPYFYLVPKVRGGVNLADDGSTCTGSITV